MGICIPRRNFIAALGGAAVAWPLAARAQQRRMPVIAFLNNASFEGWADLLRAFGQGLHESGFLEGRNVAIEFHPARGDPARLSALTEDLVRRSVDVIVTNGIATLAAKAATSTIPVVFTTGSDPVETGMVASLNRPGGNLTGVTALGDSLGPKRLELLHELVPLATSFGVLINPPNASNDLQLRALQAASQTFGLQLHVLRASTEQDFDAVFQSLVGMRVGGLVIATAPIFNNNLEKLAALTVQYAIPAIYQYGDFAAGGGLMGLGADRTETYRWLGVYAGRILKGEKPADLPIYSAIKIRLMINMKTAKALSITVPRTVLARADEIIE